MIVLGQYGGEMVDGTGSAWCGTGWYLVVLGAAWNLLDTVFFIKLL